MNGAELAALYSFPPNSHSYCGTDSFRNTLRSWLRDRRKGRKLEQELERFHPHYAYLSLIASENGLEPFDIRVVRAFWTGNRLLENISREAFQDFIERRLLPNDRPRAKRLARELPEGITPHHSFNPLYVNFVTHKVEPSMRNFDACCVTWGEILSASTRFADILRYSISWDGHLLVRPRLEVIELERSGIRLVPEIKEGDWVSVHWGTAIEKLHARERISLEKYTKINLAALNLAGWKPPHSDVEALLKWRALSGYLVQEEQEQQQE